MIGIGFDKKVVSLGCYLRVGSECKGRPDNNKQTTKNEEKVNHFDR